MSIGEDLAQARQQAGLTIAEVSRSTRIREKLIRDIEQDDYTACGGDFYTRGHIRAIAHVVGADAEQLIWEYDAAARARDEAATADTGPLTGPATMPGSSTMHDPSAMPERSIGYGPAGAPERTLPGERVPPASTGGWPRPLGTARMPGTAWPGGGARPDGTFVPGGLGTHARLPRTRRRRPVNWAVVLTLAVVAALGVVAYQFFHASGSTQGGRAAGTASGPHRGGGHAGRPAPAAKHSASFRSRHGHTTAPHARHTPSPRPTVAARPLAPVSATSFGPGGPGQGDNQQQAAQAIDASQSTAWQSDWYATPRFGGLQRGTGLLLDMGRPVTVTSARITLGSAPGAGFQVRAGATAALPGLPPVARAVNASGVVQLTITRPVLGRYVLIWFTRLPPDSSGTFQVSVYDIRLMGS